MMASALVCWLVAVGTDDGCVAVWCADDGQEIPSFTHTFRQIFHQNPNDLTTLGFSRILRVKSTGLLL